MVEAACVCTSSQALLNQSETVEAACVCVCVCTVMEWWFNLLVIKVDVDLTH